MKAIQAYLMFDGNCAEAVRFYAAAMGAELSLQTFAAIPDAPAEGRDRVLHARLVKGDAVMMASDTRPGSPGVRSGDNFAVSIDCESVDEEERIFAALSEGGDVTMALQETFWGARFGMLTDRFGISWMLNCDLNKA